MKPYIIYNYLMRNIRLTNEPRCGEEEFKSIKLSEYVKEHFGMFHGKEEHVCISLIPFLLDTVVDRFGTQGVVYNKDTNGNYIKATINVAVSDQFFAWVCGFGKRMKIVSPSPVVEDFKQYLDKMRSIYD